MNIPDRIVYTAISSIVALQAWMVRELFALKQAVAELKGQQRHSRQRSAVGLLLATSAPWVAFLLLSGCAFR